MQTQNSFLKFVGKYISYGFPDAIDENNSLESLVPKWIAQCFKQLNNAWYFVQDMIKYLQSSDDMRKLYNIKCPKPKDYMLTTMTELYIVFSIINEDLNLGQCVHGMFRDDPLTSYCVPELKVDTDSRVDVDTRFKINVGDQVIAVNDVQGILEKGHLYKVIDLTTKPDHVIIDINGYSVTVETSDLERYETSKEDSKIKITTKPVRPNRYSFKKSDDIPKAEELKKNLDKSTNNGEVLFSIAKSGEDNYISQIRLPSYDEYDINLKDVGTVLEMISNKRMGKQFLPITYLSIFK